jgi:hypothetical protein
MNTIDPGVHFAHDFLVKHYQNPQCLLNEFSLQKYVESTNC